MNIITVTLNPALDVHIQCDGFVRGEYNKGRLLRRDSGGKGINLSRALMSNGVENSCFMVLGKGDSDEFILPLYNIGMRPECILTDGRVRENINVHHDGGETVIATSGPTVGEREIAELEKRISSLIGEGSAVAFCGSISGGTDKDAVLALMYRIKERGAKLIIDSNSFSAEEMLALKPYLIKPNEEEAELLTGMRPATLAEAVRVAAAIRDSGAECVMLSMGGLGAVLASPCGEYIANAPKVDVRSTVGAGDSSIAGFLAAVANGAGYAEALSSAVAYGSAACLEDGSLPPRKENVDKLLAVIKVERFL